MSVNNNIQEWNYAHDADITFGEVHVSKAPKIALFFTIISIIIVSILCIIYKDVIRDFMANPQLVLTDSTIAIDVYSDFDPNDYITDVNVGFYEITNIQSNVNTNELGTYEVIYSSKNSVQSLDQILTVEVKDITAPVILLKTRENSNLKINFEDEQYIAEVVCGDPILDNFNPEDYIDVVLDNYSTENITLDWSRKLDFTKAGLVTVVYSATDASGNKGITTLNIAVVESFDADRQAYEDQIAEMEAELDALRNQQNNHSNNGNSSNGGSNGSNNSGNNGSNGTSGGNTPSYNGQPYHNITDASVSIDTPESVSIWIMSNAHNYISYGNCGGSMAPGSFMSSGQYQVGKTIDVPINCSCGYSGTWHVYITE